MNEIYYESGAKKEKIYLDREPFWMQTGDFLDYKWQYNVSGNKITGFQKEVKEKEFLITVFGSGETEYADNWNHIHDVFENDLRKLKPGKLYFGEYYLTCYIFASEKAGWEYDCCEHDNLYRLVMDYPFWTKEESFFIPATLAEDAPKTVYFENTHYAACDYILKAHGPFEQLDIEVGMNKIKVNIACAENEYLTINTKNETIVKTDANGNQTNAYSKQDFTLDTFKKISADTVGLSGGATISGTATSSTTTYVFIQYDRSYDVELTLLLERSEPKWEEEPRAMQYSIMTEDEYSLTTEDGYYLLGEETIGGTG